MDLGIVGAADPRKNLSCLGRVSPRRCIPVKHREAIADYHNCCAVVTRFRGGGGRGIPTLGATLTPNTLIRLDSKIVAAQRTYHIIPYHISWSYHNIHHIISYHTIYHIISCHNIYHILFNTIPYIISYLSYHISYHVMSYIIYHNHIISYHTLYHIISCHTIYIIYYFIPYHISYRIISYIILYLSYHISYHVIYHIISYHTIYHIISCHTVYHILFHTIPYIILYIISYYIIFIVSCHVISYIVSYIISHHIIYHTISCHIISRVTHCLTPLKCPIWAGLKSRLKNRREIFRYFIPKHLQYKEKLGKCLCGETFEVNVAVGLLHKLPWTVFVEADPLLRGTNMSQEEECCWTGIHGNSADKRERKWTIFKGLEW